MPPVTHSAPETDQLYAELRPLLFSIAYRLLGEASEAEDVLQEAFLRLHRARESGIEIDSPRGFLTTTTTRLCIDQLRSARMRRQQYLGPWLPEPLLVDPTPDPAERAQRADTLSLAFLTLLERLSPVERAVFVLREVFEYPYDEIARVVEKTEANTRQIFARARRHVDAGRPRFEPSAERRTELAERFLRAVLDGDVARLEATLAADAIAYFDGGGKAQAPARPIEGAERVARVLVAFAEKTRDWGLRVALATVNGQPGVTVFDGAGQPVNVVALDVLDGRVQAIRSVANADKLRHLAPSTATGRS
jgi:RNA polymerase sigma-70 factor (ECF subfamily)